MADADRVLKFMEKNSWKLFHFAAYTDWPEETLKVLIKTVQIHKPQRNDFQELAVTLGWPVEKLYKLLTSSDNINAVDKHCRTSLHIAANRDNYRFVRQFVRLKQANVNAVDEKGQTALHYAAKQGHGRVVTALCLKHADANIKTPGSGGKTPIHYAAIEGHAHVMRMLVQHGNARIDIATRNGKNVLHMAASNFDNGPAIKGIMDLAKDNFNVNDKDKSGNTALHYAAECGSLENVQILINEYIANPNVQDKTEQTPVHIASYNGDLEIVKFLVENKADLKLVDEDGVTILNYAQEAGHKRCVRYLKGKLGISLGSEDELTNSDEDYESSVYSSDDSISTNSISSDDEEE